MKTGTSQSDNNPLHGPHDFSLVLGGPLYQLLRRAHLVGDAMTLLRRRIIVLTLFAWLPLVVLSLLQGRSPGSGAVPFLLDIEVHVRFLAILHFACYQPAPEPAPNGSFSC